MNAEDLMNLLAHESLKRFENRGDGWAIVYVSHDGVSVKELFDADLNRLIRRWFDVVIGLDAIAEDREATAAEIDRDLTEAGIDMSPASARLRKMIDHAKAERN